MSKQDKMSPAKGSNALAADVDDMQIIGEEVAQQDSVDQEKSAAVKDFATADGSQLSMNVKVSSPFIIYYEGRAFSVSAESAQGPFDILPKHHNFISLLSACELTVRSSREGEKKLKISGGVMHVKADEVSIFLDV